MPIPPFLKKDFTRTKIVDEGISSYEFQLSFVKFRDQIWPQKDFEFYLYSVSEVEVAIVYGNRRWWKDSRLNPTSLEYFVGEDEPTPPKVKPGIGYYWHDTARREVFQFTARTGFWSFPDIPIVRLTIDAEHLMLTSALLNTTELKWYTKDRWFEAFDNPLDPNGLDQPVNYDTFIEDLEKSLITPVKKVRR